MLITPDGTIWPVSSYGLHRYFGFTGSTDELLHYAVRNLGAVLVFFSESFCRIRLRTDFLAQPAFERLVFLLAVHEPNRVLIEPALPGHNLVEYLTDISDVVARLEQLRSDQSSWPRNTRFSASTLELSRLRHAARPTLINALTVWRRNKGVMPAMVLKRLLDAPIGANWLLSRLTKDDLPLTETFPKYITFWPGSNLADYVGKPMTLFPDEEYTTKAAHGYELTNRTGEPLLEVIDALVIPAGGPQSHLRYDRLLLPWTTADGSRFVSSTSFTRVERSFVASGTSTARIA